ncbi:hypothetical protein VZT92_025800 [Zoarces viviparus]|uniref:Uncharacterized protein n=1 Tax=Zoarces viviparus TaxID=48416 RepID=A0AAW1DY20_ZOAVI
MDEAEQDAASSLPSCASGFYSCPLGVATCPITQGRPCPRHALPSEGSGGPKRDSHQQATQWPVCLTLDVEEGREE